jgi:integrase
MGSIKDLGNGKYQLTVSDGTGLGGKRSRHYKTIEAKNMEDAKRQLALYSDAIEKGSIKNDGKMTVESYSEIWMENYVRPNKSKKTTAGYEQLLKRANEALGHIRLSKLKAHHLTAFYNMLREDGIRGDGKKGGLSENTISHYHRLLSVMLETALVESDLIPENPARKVKDPPQPKLISKVQYYDDDEAVKFLTALEQPEVKLKYKVAVTLIPFTGFRRGEILGLEWPDIDFEKCEIFVERESQYLKEEGIYTDTPKTDNSVRSVSVPQEVINLLKQYRVWQNQQRLKCGDKWVNSERLFTQWNGLPMHPSTLTNWMRKFFLKNDIDLDKITLHGLRHTYATILIANGMDVATVSRDMGHAKKSTTLDVYTGAVKKKSKASAEVLGKALLKKESEFV